jgi:hypothetical protein
MAFDPCVYCYHEAGKCGDTYEHKMHNTLQLDLPERVLILFVYVDDLLLIGCPDDVVFVKLKLHDRFKLKDLGHITRILGLTINHNLDAGMIDLSQPDKILELATEFGLAHCKPLSTPLPAGCNLLVLDEMPATSYKLPYCCIVGALLWIALASCPDILFVTVYLTWFLCAYDHTHFNAACHVLAYLIGSAHQTIHYKCTSPVK